MTNKELKVIREALEAGAHALSSSRFGNDHAAASILFQIADEYRAKPRKNVALARRDMGAKDVADSVEPIV